jgi:hypothetical protein
MSDGARAGLALALGIAAIASIPIGLAMLCNAGWTVLIAAALALPGRLAARSIDADYSASPRLARLAVSVGRPLSSFTLFLVLICPVWLFAVSEGAWSRKVNGRVRAMAEARAVRDAELQARRTSGAYVTLECLADASRCPPAVKLALAARPSVREATRVGYRFAFHGVPQAGGDGARLDAFAYVGVPAVPESQCPLHPTGDLLVCADSTGLLCTMAMPAGGVVTGRTRCPDGCTDPERRTRSPSLHPPESAASASY